MPKQRNKPGTRTIEKRLFIICEGAKDKSESAYFKSYIKQCKASGQKVEVQVIDTRKNTGKELVKEAKKVREFECDEACVVYDKDGYTKHPETFDMAKNNKIKIAFSSISFEYWILLHFEYTSHAFKDSEEIIKYLADKKHLAYTKNCRDVFEQTKSHLSDAKKHALRIQDYQIKGNPTGTPVYDFNPYTNLNELIDEIDTMQF